MSAIEKYVPEDSEIDRMYRVAKAYSDSGFFADAKSAVEAFVKISAGAEMGLQPFVSMSGIAVIKGKPVVGAGILAGLLDSHPDFDYAVTWEPNSTEATSCTVTVFKNGKERGQSTFSMEDARKANLSSKEVWKAYTRNMLYARAMSNAVAWYAPSVTRSNGRVFVEGELDDDIVPSRPAARPIASQRPEAVSASSSEETIVDAVLEDVPDAPVAQAAEPSRTETPEGEPASGTDRAKAMLASLTAGEKAAVREACETLKIKPTPKGVYDAFSAEAFDRETFLVALSNAINGHAQAERQREEGIAEARTFEQPSESAEKAAEFQEFIADSEKRWGKGELEAAGQYGV